VRCVTPCGVQPRQAVRCKGAQSSHTHGSASAPPLLPVTSHHWLLSAVEGTAHRRHLLELCECTMESPDTLDAVVALWDALPPSSLPPSRALPLAAYSGEPLASPCAKSAFPRCQPPPRSVAAPPPSRHRRAMGQAPTPFPYSTIGPPAHGWLGWFGWDDHFGPKEQRSLLFQLRILFKSIQNFKPSEIHRN
jgi:hypothetical protein